MTNQKPASPTHQPPASRHRRGLDSSSTYHTQGQHPAPAHSRPAPEDSRGTPAPKRKDRGRQQHKSPETEPKGERGSKARQAREKQAASTYPEPAPKDTASRRTEDSQPQPMQSPSQPYSRASTAQEVKGRDRREGRKGKGERNGQKMTV